jgi:hypothetical protein
MLSRIFSFDDLNGRAKSEVFKNIGGNIGESNR